MCVVVAEVHRPPAQVALLRWRQVGMQLGLAAM
jgi:hypothetical protein